MWNFKSFSLLLVLSVLEHISAYPGCSYEDQRQCGELNQNAWRGETWPANAVELDEACRNVGSNLDCLIAFAERCPKSPQRIFLNYMKETKKLSARLCSKMDAFRSQFLKNVPCLNKHVSKLYEDCKPPYTEKVPSIQEACKERDTIFKCVVEGVSRNCGSEARQVFDTLHKSELAVNEIFCKKVLR